MSVYVAAIDGMTSHDVGDVTRLETVFLTQEGVVMNSGADLKVEQSATPAMTVKVNDGACFVLRDAYVDNDNTLKFWHVIVTADTTVNISSNSSGSTRIDRICVKVDTGVSPDATASNVATLVSVEGTPGGSAPAVPNNHLGLAQISVTNGQTQILTAAITDERPYIGMMLPQSTQGWRLKDTGANADAQYYEDTRGRVYLVSGKSGGGLVSDPTYGSRGRVGVIGHASDKIFPINRELLNWGNSGSAITIDLDKGRNHLVTLNAAAVNIVFTGGVDGGPYTIVLAQDGTGSRVPTFINNGYLIRWPGATAPTWSTTASAVDYVLFMRRTISGVVYFDGVGNAIKMS